MTIISTNLIIIHKSDCRIEEQGQDIKIICDNIVFNVEFIKAKRIMHKYFEHYQIKNEKKYLIIESEYKEGL